MKLPLSTTTLSRASAEHPWRAIGAWFGILATALVLMIALLGGTLTTQTSLTNNPESTRADELLRTRLGDTATTNGEIIVVRATTRTVDDPEFRDYVDRLFHDATALTGVVASGTTYFISGDETLVSAGRRTTLIPLTLAPDGKERIAELRQVVDSANTGGGFDVLMTGAASMDADLAKVAQEDLASGERIGLPVALLVLAVVFGTVAAAFLPIVLAIAAIILGLGATALLGQLIDMPFVVINIMTMMGLAVGIDYSLFIISRYREERDRGTAKIDAISMSGATAGRTVVLSGLTVALALAGLVIMPDSSNRAVGAGALLVVLAAMFSSITLLPALLSLLGDKIDALRIPFIQRRANHSANPNRGFWSWSTRVVMRRPVISLVLAVSLLVGAGSFYFQMHQGEVGLASMPDGMMSKDAAVILEQEFGFGQDLPVIVVIDGPTGSGETTAAIARLRTTLASDPAFVGSELDVHDDAGLSVVRTRLIGDATSDQAMAAVTHLRQVVIPDAFAGSSAKVLVTGKTATLLDVKHANDTYTPIVIAFVLGLSFLLLMVAFRSIVVPLKAILMNLLSVGAAYGMLVLVFQKGVGAELLGFQQVDVIQTGLPIFLFTVLFGLSMDYHVFLLSRIRERFQQTGDNAGAVEHGLQSTSRLITGAAMIMVAVFGGFALGDLVPLQQMGFGLAVAVLIDATIVRSVLVPASMRLLGDWNWYLPNILRWLPELKLERHETAPVSAPAN